MFISLVKNMRLEGMTVDGGGQHSTVHNVQSKLSRCMHGHSQVCSDAVAQSAAATASNMTGDAHQILHKADSFRVICWSSTQCQSASQKEGSFVAEVLLSPANLQIIFGLSQKERLRQERRRQGGGGEGGFQAMCADCLCRLYLFLCSLQQLFAAVLQISMLEG